MSEITNGEELNVLRRYAAGEDLKAISEALGFPVKDGAPDEVVVGIVSSLAGFQRNTARELVRRAEATMAQRAGASPKPAPPLPAVAAPVVRKVTATMPPEPPLGAEVMLVRAERAGGKYATKAGRIRALVAALESELAEAERVIAQEQRVKELRAELERASAKLRGSPTSAPHGPAASSGNPTPREVRAWAAEAGVECGPIGRVPGPVMDAYRAAHPEVAA